MSDRRPVAAAELWTRVDITAEMTVGVVAPLLTAAPLLTFRPRAVPSAA